MRKFALSFLCIVLIFSAPFALADDSFTGWKAEVNEKIENGDFEGAAADLKAHEGEKDADYHYLMAKNASSQGDLDIALKQLEQALAINPKHSLSMKGKAVVLYEQGKVSEAEKTINRAIELEPNGELYYARSAIHLSRGELKKSLVALDAAISMEPKNVDYFIARGQVNLQLSQVQKAETDYTKAIAIDPASAKSYLERGWLYRLKGDATLARADLDKCVELAPEFSKCYLGRGLLYQLTGEQKRAYDDFVKATDLEPDSPEAWFERANQELILRKFDAAENSAKQVVRIKDGSNAQLFLGQVYTARGKLDEAIGAFNKTIDAVPGDVEALLYRANAYAMKKEYDKALIDLDQSIKLQPKFIKAYLAKAGIYFEQNNMKGAIKAYDAAIAASPDDPTLYHLRSQLHERAGNYDASFADFKKAKELEAKIREKQ